MATNNNYIFYRMLDFKSKIFIRQETMPKRTVCNIKPIMALGFILGVNQFPKQISKFITLLIGLANLTLMYIFAKTHGAYVYGACFTYVIHVLISIQTGDAYIYHYFKYYNGIDHLSGANKIFKRLDIFFKAFTIFIILVKVIAVCLHCQGIPHRCYNDGWLTIFLTESFWLAIEICKLPFVLIFSLLYCRVKVIRQYLETEVEKALNSFNVKEYINKYEILVHTLEVVKYPIQFMVRSNWYVTYLKIICFIRIVFANCNSYNKLQTKTCVVTIVNCIF